MFCDIVFVKSNTAQLIFLIFQGFFIIISFSCVVLMNGKFSRMCEREGVSDSVHSYSQIRGGVSLDKLLSFAGALPRASVAKTFQIWQ